MRWLAAIVAAVALPALADIAPVISWPVDVTQQNPYPLTLRRGETVILQPTYNQDLTGTDTVVLKTRASGASLPSCVTGSVYSATGGVARIRFDVTLANGIYQYEVALISSNAANLRGNGTLTVVDSMAGEIATTPPTGTGDTLAPSEPEGSYPNDIAPVITWKTTPGELTPYNHTINQGETVILRPKLQGYDLSGTAAVALRYRPIGASGWHYVAPGTVHNATNGEIQVRWNSMIEGTNSAYQYEIALQSPSAFVLGAIGTITRRPSLSGSSTSMPTRVTAFDWAAVDHVNIGSAPFLSLVALAPFSAFWASLTNGTADLNVHSLLIDGVPVGTGGVARGSGTYTNTMINGISHTGAVAFANGTNTTWRKVNGVWYVDVPVIEGPTGPQGATGQSWTNTIVVTNLTIITSTNIIQNNSTNIAIAMTVSTNLITSVVTNLSLWTSNWISTNINITNDITGMTQMPATWDADEIGTNALYIKSGGQVMERHDTDGITMLHGSLQLYDEDLNCNVRLYDGARTAPSLTFRGHTNEWGLYDRGYNGNYVAAWSVAGTEVGVLHAGGITLMSTNFSFNGRVVGDLSGATGYPEPIFASWRTNMSFSSISISNLVITPGGVYMRDELYTDRGSWTPATGIRIRDAGATLRAALGSSGLSLNDSLGRTVTTLSDGLTLYDGGSRQTLLRIGNYSILWYNANGSSLATLDPSNGLILNDLSSFANRTRLSQYELSLVSPNGITVFSVDSQSSLKTTINDLIVTNAGNIVITGANGLQTARISGTTGNMLLNSITLTNAVTTNSVSLTSTNGALALNGRVVLATNYPSFILTNVYGGVTSALWFANGIVTNKTP